MNPSLSILKLCVLVIVFVAVIAYYETIPPIVNLQLNFTGSVTSHIIDHCLFTISTIGYKSKAEGKAFFLTFSPIRLVLDTHWVSYKLPYLNRYLTIGGFFSGIFMCEFSIHVY